MNLVTLLILVGVSLIVTGGFLTQFPVVKNHILSVIITAAFGALMMSGTSTAAAIVATELSAESDQREFALAFMLALYNGIFFLGSILYGVTGIGSHRAR